MEVIRTNTPYDVARFAGDAISRLLIDNADRPTLLLVSGGSSMSVLDYMHDVSVRGSFQVGLVDERWSPRVEDLNATAFNRTGFKRRLSERGIPFVSINTKEDSPEESARLYEEYLKQWRSLMQNGIVIALLGIGMDGHIAGIMPYPENKEWFDETFLNTKRWTVGYKTGGKGDFPVRITSSLHFLMQEVDHSFVCAIGEGKRVAIEKTLSPDGTLSETPARIINDMRNARLFTDVK